MGEGETTSGSVEISNYQLFRIYIGMQHGADFSSLGIPEEFVEGIEGLAQQLLGLHNSGGVHERLAG